MRLLEHHSKALLGEQGVRFPRGRLCRSGDDAADTAATVGPVAVKALVARGGRGKAGGVRFAETSEEARSAAVDILGSDLGGETVDEVLVEEWVTGEEIFVSWTYDFDARSPVLLASRQGGVDIEEEVASSADVLIRHRHDPRREFFPYEGRRIASELMGLSPKASMSFGAFAAQLWNVFSVNDAWLTEVNPAIIGADGSIVAASAVIELDDGAAFRHPSWDAMRPAEESTELEAMVEAADRADPNTSGVRFQQIEGGDLLYLVFGGGSGLTYFDYVYDRGFTPATYVDVSPGRGLDKIRLVFDAAFSLPPTRGVVMTLPHANLAQVDRMAEQFVASYKEHAERWAGVPVVVRMCGPGEDRARTLLSEIPVQVFGDEVTIEQAIDSLLDQLRAAAEGRP
jgi:succinyl-CoA synthetase beta subunit